MSVDLKIDDAGNLVIENGDLVLISDAEEVAQSCRMRLLSRQAEWILDVDSGIDQLKLRAVNVSQDVKDRIIKSEILGTPHVKSILWYQFGVNRNTNTIYIDFGINTDFGPTVVQVIT